MGSTNDFSALIAAVRRNCHISDALHAGNYTMCVFLLKMREHYRWEQGYGFDAALPQTEVADWLQQRERLWQELEDSDYGHIPIGHAQVEPFDSHTANGLLMPRGLVYSAGWGRFAKPVFFLARLLRREQYQGFTILEAGEEYARELSAPIAMTQAGTIFLRRAGVRQMLAEKWAEWQWKKADNALGRALQYFGFHHDAAEALERMTGHVLELVKQHEIGEGLAGDLLGPEWEEMLLVLAPSKAEGMARAVRDQLADSLSTLPSLLQRDDPGLWHFYRGSLGSAQQALLPGLAGAYQSWMETGSTEALAGLVDQGRRHWPAAAESLLDLYRAHGAGCRAHIEAISERAIALS